jgi:hypothetical protein
LASLLLIGAFTLVSGCASAPGASPAAPEEPQAGADDGDGAAIGSATEVERELDRAEQQLLAALDGPAQHQLAGDDAESAPAEPAAGQAAPLSAPQGERRAGGRCAVACRALSSMRRSAVRLCSITGDDDERCAHAERRLSRAADLVRRSCSACE